MLTAKRENFADEEEYVDYAEPKQLKHFSKRPSVASYYRDCDDVSDVVTENYNEDYDSGIVRNSVENQKRAEESISAYRDAAINEQNEDFLTPSHETMRSLSADKKAVVSAAAQQKTEQHVKINMKGKAMIAVYVAIILAIIIVIAVNAVAIGSLSASVAGLETEIGTVSEQYKNKNTELSEVSYPDTDTVPDGFIKVSAGNGGVIVTLPQVAAKPDTYKNTNWFDAVCEFFSSIFGG